MSELHNVQGPERLRDLNSEEAISDMVDTFYARVLKDPLLRPVFVEVAGVDLDNHLPRIKAYWRKMLLGHRDYQGNMVTRHQAIHKRFPLQTVHFQRWLSLFEQTLTQDFSGPKTDRARRLARTIIGNLQCRLEEQGPHACPRPPDSP